MKKILAFALALTLILSISVTAFADKSPSASAEVAVGPDDYALEVCNSSDKVIDLVPSNKITRLGVGQAGSLDEADRKTFLDNYEEVKKITDKLVLYFFWLDVKNYEKPADFAYYRYWFSCSGENVKVTVNGKEMSVVNVEGSRYYAKLTELGAIAIICDK